MLYKLYCLLLFNIVFATGRFGPYRCILVKVQPCEKPTKPVVKDPPIAFEAAVYNTTKKSNLLRGNFTVIRETRCKRINTKAYYWELGRWNPQYMMNNMGCNSVFLPLAQKITGVNMDTKSCKFLKGSYVYQNLDVNEMQHTWMSTQEYGRILWVTELFSHAGSVFCWEFETLNKPA